MDYFNNVLTMFLGLKCGGFVVHAGAEITIKNILIRVPKMNKGLTGLEWHEGE